MALVQEFDSTNSDLTIKFVKTLRINSITNDKFSLYQDGATLTPITDPFRPINASQDPPYNSISRTLTILFKNGVITPSTGYVFRASGLIDVSGATVPDYTATFTSDSSPLSTPPQIPEAEPVVEDHSLITASVLSPSTSINVTNADFYIVSTEPEPGELMVQPDRNAGRVSIEFSRRPSSEFLTSKYFKAQRKLIQRAPNRWVDLGTQISLGPSNTVFVDFPSSDATPLYGVAGKTYFEAGFKYRLKISKLVGI